MHLRRINVEVAAQTYTIHGSVKQYALCNSLVYTSALEGV